MEEELLSFKLTKENNAIKYSYTLESGGEPREYHGILQHAYLEDFDMTSNLWKFIDRKEKMKRF